MAVDLDRDDLAILLPQREAVGMGLLGFSQSPKKRSADRDIFEATNFPQLPAAKFLKRIIEQIDGKGIRVADFTVLGVEQEIPTGSLLEEAAIAKFESLDGFVPVRGRWRGVLADSWGVRARGGLHFN